MVTSDIKQLACDELLKLGIDKNLLEEINNLKKSLI